MCAHVNQPTDRSDPPIDMCALHFLPENSTAVRIGILGARAVGKTSLVERLISERFVETHNETIMERYTSSVPIDRRNQSVEVVEIGGDIEALQQLRDELYPTCHAFIIVMDANDPQTLYSARTLFDQIHAFVSTCRLKARPMCVLAINKHDVVHYNTISSDVMKGLVELYIPLVWAEFFFTSARLGLNIGSLFAAATKLAIENRDFMREIDRQEANGSPVSSAELTTPGSTSGSGIRPLFTNGSGIFTGSTPRSARLPNDSSARQRRERFNRRSRSFSDHNANAPVPATPDNNQDSLRLARKHGGSRINSASCLTLPPMTSPPVSSTAPNRSESPQPKRRVLSISAPPPNSMLGLRSSGGNNNNNNNTPSSSSGQSSGNSSGSHIAVVRRKPSECSSSDNSSNNSGDFIARGHSTADENTPRTDETPFERQQAQCSLQ
jgi:GTPase SAR1 family protein